MERRSRRSVDARSLRRERVDAKTFGEKIRGATRDYLWLTFFVLLFTPRRGNTQEFNPMPRGVMDEILKNESVLVDFFKKLRSGRESPEAAKALIEGRIRDPKLRVRALEDYQKFNDRLNIIIDEIPTFTIAEFFSKYQIPTSFDSLEKSLRFLPTRGDTSFGGRVDWEQGVITVTDRFADDHWAALNTGAHEFAHAANSRTDLCWPVIEGTAEYFSDRIFIMRAQERDMPSDEIIFKVIEYRAPRYVFRTILVYLLVEYITPEVYFGHYFQNENFLLKEKIKRVIGDEVYDRYDLFKWGEDLTENDIMKIAATLVKKFGYKKLRDVIQRMNKEFFFNRTIPTKRQHYVRTQAVYDELKLRCSSNSIFVDKEVSLKRKGSKARRVEVICARGILQLQYSPQGIQTLEGLKERIFDVMRAPQGQLPRIFVYPSQEVTTREILDIIDRVSVQYEDDQAKSIEL